MLRDVGPGGFDTSHMEVTILENSINMMPRAHVDIKTSSQVSDRNNRLNGNISNHKVLRYSKCPRVLRAEFLHRLSLFII